jgi:hypothetical protein
MGWLESSGSLKGFGVDVVVGPVVGRSVSQSVSQSVGEAFTVVGFVTKTKEWLLGLCRSLSVCLYLCLCLCKSIQEFNTQMIGKPLFSYVLSHGPYLHQLRKEADVANANHP